MSDPRTLREDPRFMVSDPRTLREDRRFMVSDPRTVREDTRFMVSDPRTVREDPRFMVSDPRTVRELKVDFSMRSRVSSLNARRPKVADSHWLHGPAEASGMCART